MTKNHKLTFSISKWTLTTTIIIFEFFHQSISFAQNAITSNDPQLISYVFEKIKTDYVDPIDESAILAACNDAIHQTLNERLPEKLSNEALPNIGEFNIPISEQSIDFFVNKFPNVATKRELEDSCLRAMLGGLDSRSAYLDSKSLKELMDRSRVVLGSLGIELGIDEGVVTVAAYTDDSPARKSDLLIGDIIKSIDGVDVQGMKIDEMGKLLTGPAGSIADLAIERQRTDSLMKIQVTREARHTRSLTAKIVGENYFYIKLRQITEFSVEELCSELRIKGQVGLAEMRGIVLDLRNNPGGLLPSMIGVAAVFLPKSTKLGSISGRVPESNQQFYGDPVYYSYQRPIDPLRDLPGAVKKLPLIILVNQKTASGSEMIAATLQDFRRAKVFGEQTLGYGTVQTITKVANDAAIKLTTGRLVRPNGEAIDKNGVKPDYEMQMKNNSSTQYGSIDDRELSQAIKTLQ